jgi:hypothetical protein
MKMSDSDTGTPPVDFDALLRERYPTFAAIVADVRATGDQSKLRHFVDSVQREVATEVVAATNSKKRAEAEGVLRALEAATALALQVAFPRG